MTSDKTSAQSTFDPARYGDAVAALISGDPKRDLAERIKRLGKISDAELFGARSVIDREMAAACRAALWLWLDDLDRSHTISQDLHTPTGSFLHGIMHRREPDYSNAKYWFHRVGPHPTFGPMATAARQIAQAAGPLPPEARYLLEQPTWDPFRFTDWCEGVDRGRAAGEPLYRESARLEWSILFDYCYHATIGEAAAEG